MKTLLWLGVFLNALVVAGSIAINKVDTLTYVNVVCLAFCIVMLTGEN